MLVPPPSAAHVLSTWQEAVQLVRAQSTTLKTARARIIQARGQANITLSPALPTLTATGSVSDNLIRGTSYRLLNNEVVQVSAPYPAEIWSAALNLRVPVIAPRTWYDHGTAKDAIDAAVLDSEDVERQLVGVVANAIVAVVTNERLAEVSRVSLASALSTLDLNKRRAALGASSMVDVLRAEQEVTASRAQVISADESLIRSREALGDALGSSDAWGVASGIQLESLGRDARASCTEAAGVEVRADVRSAAQSVKIAERNVKSVDYSFVPTVDAVSTFTYFGNEMGSPTLKHTSWTVGGLLTWQIFDGGSRYGQREARKGDLGVANQRLSETRRHALIEVTQALRGVTVAESNLTVARRNRDVLSETARLTKVAYLNGTGTSFDLVDAARRLREAEIDLTIKEFQVTSAKIAALLALSTCKI